MNFEILNKLDKSFVKNSFIKRTLFLFLSNIIRFIKNFIPPKNRLNPTLHFWQKIFKMFSYKYYSVEDYCKHKNLTLSSYEIQSGKVYILNNSNDLNITVYNTSTVIHDSKCNIILESVMPNSSLGCIHAIVYDNVNINRAKNSIYIDEAINFACIYDSNYWHFTFWVIDKIFDLEQNGYKGKYIIFNKSYLCELLALLDVPKDRIIYANHKDSFHVEKLHIFKDFGTKNIPLLIKAKNKIISNISFKDNKEYPKRLYIRRLGNYSRKVSNEDEIINLLKKYDFELFFPDDFSVEEQIKYFNNADIIVSPHGACSTNALYMKPYSHFIECFSYTWLNPCMLDIVQPNNMYYHMIVEKVCPEYSYKVRDSRDFKIDPLLLEDTIYKIANNTVHSI